jgi:hypothetical protein
VVGKDSVGGSEGRDGAVLHLVQCAERIRGRESHHSIDLNRSYLSRYTSTLGHHSSVQIHLPKSLTFRNQDVRLDQRLSEKRRAPQTMY